ncbi:hypothetical protein ACEQ8H_001939 [Pleosporales sp. CAS-2024a]
MASYGHVLDLLDDRYLKNVQDVHGHVEPIPRLVPHDEYKHTVIVYRMKENHETWLGRMQDYTARVSAMLGKEMWTWNVQWEVDEYNVSMPSPKKPRLDDSQHDAAPIAYTAKHRKPIIDSIHACIINPDLFEEEEMLRALINIVQVETCMVPNVVEWLYQWIDHFEGDGTALKAALKWEIPSLWDFDYHPLILPEYLKKQLADEALTLSKERAKIESDAQPPTGSKIAVDANIRVVAQDSPTKRIRQVPSLATLERRLQDNERSKYKEVKYGIKPPKTEEPFPPLINIPLDDTKRAKYYDACYRSRHRALVLLLEAGISLQQICNYVKGQKAHPRDTSHDGGPNIQKSLRYYHKDAEAGRHYFRIRESLRLKTIRQNEAATSTRLDNEAERIAAGQASAGRTDVPSAPELAEYTPRPDIAARLLSRLQAAKTKDVDMINFVPTPLVGRLKSKYLAQARDMRESKGLVPPDTDQAPFEQSADDNFADIMELLDAQDDSEEDDGDIDDDLDDGELDEEDNEVENEDEDDGSDDNLVGEDVQEDDGSDDDNDDDHRPSNHPVSQPTPVWNAQEHAQQPAPFLRQPPIRNVGGPAAQTLRAQAAVTNHLQLLTPNEARDFARVQQQMSNIIASRRAQAQTQAPAAASEVVSLLEHLTAMPRHTNPNTMNHAGALNQVASSEQYSRFTPMRGADQTRPQSGPMLFRPPTLTFQQARPVAPNIQQFAVPAQFPSQASAGSATPSAPSTARWTLEHFLENSQSRPPPPAPLNASLNSTAKLDFKTSDSHTDATGTSISLDAGQSKCPLASDLVSYVDTPRWHTSSSWQYHGSNTATARNRVDTASHAGVHPKYL